MIPEPVEIARSLRGALQLARFDATGLALFERHHDGFWCSFFAAALAAPAYFALVVLRLPDGQDLTSRRFAIEFGGYVVAWLAYPYVVTMLVRLVDREQRYFDYMVPYNWAAVLQVHLLLALAVAIEGGIAPPKIGLMLELAAVTVIMVYQGFIARAGLLIGPARAVAFVAIDLLLNLLIARLVRIMI